MYVEQRLDEVERKVGVMLDALAKYFRADRASVLAEIAAIDSDIRRLRRKRLTKRPIKHSRKPVIR